MKRSVEAASIEPSAKRPRAEEDVEMGQEVASLDQAFDELVERFPMRPAVEDDDGCVMSYRQLQEASRRIAAGMAQLCRGQDAPIVALLMRRNCNWLAASLATMRLGTLLALSCDLGGDDEERRNREAMAEHQPRLLVLERSAAVPSLFTTSAVAYVEDLLRTEECFVERPRRHLDDAVYLVYTGGTTAASKCVVQTHRMALHELRTYADFQALSCEDRILHHTSAFWGAACHGMMDLAWSCGACLVMLSRHGVNEVARAISERNITVAGIVPSLLDALDDKRCQSLRTVFTWGEPLRQTTLEFWRTRVQLLDLLIASEYWLVLYADHRRSGGGFRPVPGARLTLLSCAAEDASSLSKVVEVAPGEVGELYIAGAMVSAQGYTKASFNEGAFLELPVGPGGSMLRHYRTRDLARVLPDGTLEYCGRADGFAKVGGKWLDLASVERSLQSAGCREASLLWDEVTKVRHACVVPNQLHKPMAAAVQTWQALVPPQTRLHLLKELPKNAATGKIARGVLLQNLRKQETSASGPPRPICLSRSLAVGLRLARGLVKDGALVPLTFTLAPGLSELLWRGQYGDDTEAKDMPNGGEAKGNVVNGSKLNGKESEHPTGPLVPLGVAERLSSWMASYRSISSYLTAAELELLPYLCLLLLDGSITGLEGLARVFQAPMGILGGAIFLCRWSPGWAKFLWLLAGQSHAKRRGGNGWTWLFWLGFPGFADSWSHSCWHSWPQGRSSGAWQALSGIVKELRHALPEEGDRKECRELLRCTYCWDWVPDSACATWRHKHYCSECTEGWESYKDQRCAELGVDTVSPDPTPSTTPYSTPAGTPTATPRATAKDRKDTAKKNGPSVVTIDFADYEVKLAQRQVPGQVAGAGSASAASAKANGHVPKVGSKVAQVLEKATGLRPEEDQLAGLESLKVIILVSALRRELGVNLAAGDVIQCSTLSELEEMVQAAAKEGQPETNDARHDEAEKGYPIYAIPRFWKAPVGWLIRLNEVPNETSMRIACRALVKRHSALRAVPYRSLGDEASASLGLSAVQTLLVLRSLFGLAEVESSRAPLDAAAAQGLWDAWPRVQCAPAAGGLPMCNAGGLEESAHFEWLSFENEADLRHAAWLKARSRGFRTPASMSVLFLPAASNDGKDVAYLQIAVNHAVTDAASIVPMVADLLEFHRAAKVLGHGSNGSNGSNGTGDLEASAEAVLEHTKLPVAPDGLAIAEERLQGSVLGTKVPGWEERLDLLHNSCPPRKRGYDHYVKFTPSAGRVLEAASSVTGIPTDHLLVAALAASLSFAQRISEVKLTLIVPMRDGPGHGQAVSNLASTRHLSVWAQERSLFDIAFELSSRFRRRDWHTCQLLDDNGDRLFINLRGIPAFDGAVPVIEPQDTTRKPTRFVRNIVEMFADQETLHSWTMWMGLREDVDASAFSRALRKALWGLATCPLNPLD